MSKTVFISVFQPFISRNILNTGVLDELMQNNTRIILFVPTAKADFYKGVYKDELITIEPFDVEARATWLDRRLRNLAELLIHTNTKRFHKLHFLFNTRRYIKYFIEVAITALFGRSSATKKLFRFAESKLNNIDGFGYFFEKYKPDIVFVPDIFGDGDVLLLKSAKKRGVRTIGMVLSWDNNTSKHLMRVVPDGLIVQNEIIKDEAIEIQAVPWEIIRVVGIAHYDHYKTYNPVSRKEYFDRIGADPKKRLIVFSPAGEKFVDTDWQICQILKEAFAVGTLPGDVLVLVRVHPTNPSDLSRFVPNEHFIIETPGVKFKGVREKDKELDMQSLHHLLDTLHHSEVVVNVVSSLVIDAAVLDKPIITIAFEGLEQKVHFVRSVNRYLMEENMAKLLDIGGTLIVQSPEELVAGIKSYLGNPEADRDGRRRIVDRQCWKLDGKAKTRVAEILLNNF